MLDLTSYLSQSATEVLGDPMALAEQLGGADGLTQLPMAAASLGRRQIDTLPALRSFLEEYSAAILLAHEVPAVLASYQFAAHTQVRELIALDQQLDQIPALQQFSRASWTVGRAQLRRLRPLRDERVVQRYWKAVESGEAHGWHSLVFGMVLALYSLPLRQGLLHFAYSTVSGFIESASDRFTIPNAERADLLSKLSQSASQGVERALLSSGRSVPGA
jgi:urease accessory protein UreF